MNMMETKGLMNQKPIDFGYGKLAASLHRNGQLHSINAYHSQHGYFTLSPIESFPNDKWYDSQFVRNYRRSIAATTDGFGLSVAGADYDLDFLDWNTPRLSSTLNNISIEKTFAATEADLQSHIVEKMAVENRGPEAATFTLTIGGMLSISRSSYGQLTEGGPIKIKKGKNQLTITENQALLLNEEMNMKASIHFLKDKLPLHIPESSMESYSPLEFVEEMLITLEPYEKVDYYALYTLEEANQTISPDVKGIIEETENALSHTVPVDSPSFEDYVIHRNLNYIKNCCATPTSTTSTCLLTDHQFLPLSWNRDAYFMAKLLFHQYLWMNNGEEDSIKQTLKNHLSWLFTQADRPDKYWGRSYLANGYCKDHIFQLDQQCYPLIELCEYVQLFDEPELINDYSNEISGIIDLLFSQKAPDNFLFKTEETPADDDVEYPYHLSSQILVWNTFKNLNNLSHLSGLNKYPFEEWMNQITEDIKNNFIVDRDGAPLYAYLTDLNGNYRFYHDANDLPFVLAPLWGFCDQEDPVWQETMAFALSEENEGGYYPGQFGGLGSVHTRHAWPLGLGQELLYAYLNGNDEEVENIKSKLKRVIQSDGLFSEAIDENTGEVTSREWFSWPGAFISSVFLVMEHGKKEF